MRKHLYFTCLLVGLVLLSNCEKEIIIDPYEHPIDLELSSDWFIYSVTADSPVVWYRINLPAEATGVWIEWTDANNQAADQSFKATVRVSAYHLDGKTSYFVDKRNGYGSSAKEISLSGSDGLLIKVEMIDEIAGDYGLKVYESNTPGELDLLEVPIQDVWSKFDIGTNQVVGFEFTNAMANQVYSIAWAEYGSPEEGFTADIKGSVYQQDGKTPYKDLNNGKSIVGKNKSHSDNPKQIRVLESENSFIITITLNDISKPGSFAIKVF